MKNFVENQVKAVIFDLGGTLIKTSEIPHVMKKILEDSGINRSLDKISKVWLKVHKETNYQDLKTLLDEFWVQWNQRILFNLDLKSENRKLAKFIASHWWNYSEVTLFPDAMRVLPLLKKKNVKLGVITNGLKSDIKAILPKVDLQKFFDVVVVIDTLRKMKPDIEVFTYALEKLGVENFEAIFVGDEVPTDYEGALNAGLTVYLIDRRKRIKDSKIKTITSLEDIIKFHFYK